MPRLSDGDLEALCDESRWQPVRYLMTLELVRGYRREAVLEAMLREWAEEATLTTAVCGKCGGVSGSIAHYKCLVARTEALLGETE